MKEIIKYILIPCMVWSLTACDTPAIRSALYQTCANIALSRLKHPNSFDTTAGTEWAPPDGPTHIEIKFSAWNDYKVPIPHKIECIFQKTNHKKHPVLLSIKWNNRPIRSHELDYIREKFES
ncbi:MAG: hypothetical protein COB49_10605 [Alphaproteobacteria bacterium]|nr:MAG: hypothetical protein COB49_10605 [Alphaproteobacteria bacterium]